MGAGREPAPGPMETRADLEARERRLLDLYEECVWSDPARVAAIERALAGVQREIERTGVIRELYFDLLSALDRFQVELYPPPSDAARELYEQICAARNWLLVGDGAAVFRRIVDAARNADRNAPLAGGGAAEGWDISQGA